MTQLSEFKIPYVLSEKIIEYLYGQPYGQVNHLIMGLQASHQMASQDAELSAANDALAANKASAQPPAEDGPKPGTKPAATPKDRQPKPE